MSLSKAYPDLLSRGETRLLLSLYDPPVAFEAREAMIRANAPLRRSLFLSTGFVGRYRVDHMGRRLLLALQIPGDFIDLPSYVLGQLDHDIDSFTPVTVRPMDHARIGELRGKAPDLYDKLWRVSMMDAAIHRYWIFRLGRLAGRVRIANFLAETMVRLYARGLCGLNGCTFPINQIDLAEACGMTSVHTNRMISELRAEGVCNFTHGQLEVPDFGNLLRAGRFDWDFLQLPQPVQEELAHIAGRRQVRRLSSRG